MPSMDVMGTTTTATDCGWSFHGAAEAPEAVTGGSVEHPGEDMDLHPDAQSTGSLCQVNEQARAVYWPSVVKDLVNVTLTLQLNKRQIHLSFSPLLHYPGADLMVHYLTCV